MLRQKHLNLLSLLLVSAALSGCYNALTYVEPQTNSSRPQVFEDSEYERVPLSFVSPAYVQERAEHYRRFGGAGMSVTVVYDPDMRGHAQTAQNALTDVLAGLRSYGVQEIKGNVIPVNNLASEPELLFSYTTYKAQGPEDCEIFTALQKERLVEVSEDYKFGCTVDTYFAKQIARPKDLMEPAKKMRPAEASRAAALIKDYREGIRNDPLVGEDASN